MICSTETDLHNLLDELTDGEHVKATWTRGAFLTINEGPVSIDSRGQRWWWTEGLTTDVVQRWERDAMSDLRKQ